MSPLKKGEILENETVETVEKVMLFKINPRLCHRHPSTGKSGVNNKLPVIITVSLISKRSRWDRDTFGKQFLNF